MVTLKRTWRRPWPDLEAVSVGELALWLASVGCLCWSPVFTLRLTSGRKPSQELETGGMIALAEPADLLGGTQVKVTCFLFRLSR